MPPIKSSKNVKLFFWSCIALFIYHPLAKWETGSIKSRKTFATPPYRLSETNIFSNIAGPARTLQVPSNVWLKLLPELLPMYIFGNST